jgi:hypothetical protein
VTMFFEYYNYKFLFRCFWMYSYFRFKNVPEKELDAEEIFEYKY